MLIILDVMILTEYTAKVRKLQYLKHNFECFGAPERAKLNHVGYFAILGEESRFRGPKIYS